MGFYTDIAYENCNSSMVKIKDDLKYGCEEIVLSINSQREQEVFDKPKGEYYLLNCPNLNFLSNVVADYVTEQLSDYLKKIITQKIGAKKGKILVVGLGNENIVADSLGVKSVSKLIVTSGLKDIDDLGYLSAFCPGVVGQTGLKTSEVIKSIVQTVKPDLVILVDSLCAISTNRLGCSFQITDSGIRAGNAVSRESELINKKFLGVPTIVIGSPIVVKTETIVGEILQSLSEESNIDNKEYLYKLNNLIVAPKEVEQLIRLDSDIIAHAINMVVHGLSIDEQRLFNY